MELAAGLALQFITLCSASVLQNPAFHLSAEHSSRQAFANSALKIYKNIHDLCHIGNHTEFSPLRNVKQKPKNLQEKSYKTNQTATNVLCLQRQKYTCYGEEHSILTKFSGSYHPLVAANSILNITFTNF